MKTWFVVLSMLLSFPSLGLAQESELAAEVRELRQKLERLEKKLEMEDAAREKRAEEERAAMKAEVKKDVISEVTAKGQSFFDRLIAQTKVGAYGSMRYGASNLENNTFTFRRFVLTVDAPITERLKANMELEFERFTQLEMEKTTTKTPGGGLTTVQAIEGNNQSEISLEQAWMQYDIAEWLKFRGGAVLVPLGRFNINHDDNRWDLPRRSLVDRGVPVLPSTAAWDELGVGFLGDIQLTEDMLLNYQAYVVNGVSLDFNFEQIAQTRFPEPGKQVIDVELEPSSGTFFNDVKNAKAFTGRVALSPALGQEIGASWYYGRYTPSFLPDEKLWSLAGDFKSVFGSLELEGEYVFTHFGGVRN